MLIHPVSISIILKLTLSKKWLRSLGQWCQILYFYSQRFSTFYSANTHSKTHLINLQRCGKHLDYKHYSQNLQDWTSFRLPWHINILQKASNVICHNLLSQQSQQQWPLVTNALKQCSKCTVFTGLYCIYILFSGRNSHDGWAETIESLCIKMMWIK